MDIRIIKPIQGGTIQATASKSEAHRLLICAALADCETFISCPERSEDIDATAGCLEALGTIIKYERDGFHVTPVKRSSLSISAYNLDCGESGSTLRFLRPVCAALGLNVYFKMGGRLPERPLWGNYDEQLKHGTHTLPGNISSQFISGLLFALPLLSGDSMIRVTGVLESRPYVDMTLNTLRLFDIKISEEEPNVFIIQGNQTYRSPKTVRAEGDWSNAAFWLSAGAIGKNSVTCTNLNSESKQGDKLITELLARFGANVTCGDNSVCVSAGKLAGIDIDTGDTPDLVPVLAAVASVAVGTTVIRNAGRLRIKESDRLRTVTAALSDLGADIAETENGLIIKGKTKLSGGETRSFGDHRLAMTAAIISMACTGGVVIRDAEAVRKSYPKFFEDFNAVLGGKWEEC